MSIIKNDLNVTKAVRAQLDYALAWAVEQGYDTEQQSIDLVLSRLLYSDEQLDAGIRYTASDARRGDDALAALQELMDSIPGDNNDTQWRPDDLRRAMENAQVILNRYDT